MTRADRLAARAGALLLAASAAVSSLGTPRPAPAPLGDVLPGITREVVCDRGYAQRVRHVTDAQKAEVFRLAGIPAVHRALYEVDHVVPLAVGGSNRAENLSPQLWTGADGALLKDRVEAFAWRQVCAGKLTIAEAQAIFRTPGGWQAALRDNHLAPPPAAAGGAPASMRAEDHDEEGFPR